MTRNLIVRAAFVASVGLSLLIAAGANAQAPAVQPGPGTATTEAVIVTGSNIPTAEEVTASPLDTLNAREIERAGTQDVLTVLQKRNPDFVGAGNIGNSNANISSGGTLGGAVASIRGLASLVLFEGRRIADSAAIAVGGAQFSDVNLFPVSLIGRIEVLKDGASAIYGSDAVGGVINIFLKDDFTGLEIGYRYGFTVESGVAERRGYVMAGTGNDTTHVTVGFQYYEIDALFQRERGYSSPPRGLLGGVTTTYAGSARDATSRFLLDPALNSPFDAGVVAGSVPIPPNPQYADPALLGTFAPASVAEVTSFDLSTQPTNTLQVENTDLYGSFSHQICGKQLEAFGSLLYAHNESANYLNAQPLSNATGVEILGSFRVDPLTGAIVAENRGSPAEFNPFQLSIDGQTLAGPNRNIIGNRYQTNPRIFTQNSDFYRVLGGLKSQINKDWYVEGAAYYSHYGLNFVNQNLVKADQLNAMIAGTALDNDGLPIPALDFFARDPVGTGPGQVSQAQFSTIFGSNLRQLTSYQRAFDGKIVGFPFEIPGGPIGVAVGGEHRIEGFKVIDSPEIFVGSVPIAEIVRGRAIDSAYGEIKIPVVGSQMNVPWIRSLEITAAGRFDHYQEVKEDAKVPKLTLRYQPFADLTARATYSNSFVAPNLFQLFGPAVQGFSDTITFNGVVQDQAQVIGGSNPDLVPATAESYTAGIVYSPHFVPGLVITTDYFRTLQQKIVTAFGGQKILNSVNNLGPASPFASQVALNNFPGRPGFQPITMPGELTDNLQSVFYFDPLVNIGAARIEGFDLSAHYTWDLHAAGQLELGVNSVVFTQYKLKSDPNSDYYNILGLNFTEFGGIQGGGAFPDYRVTGLVEYRFQGWSLALNANYIPELLNAVGHDPEFEDQDTFATIEDYITIDGRLSYAFHRTPPPPPPVPDAKDAKDSKAVAGVTAAEGCNWLDKMVDGLTLTVGCNNMLDEDPRLVEGANSATNLSIYDPYGRFVYFEVSKKF